METQIVKTESLEELETIIENSIKVVNQGFEEAGIALRIIKDGKHYKKLFDTFEDYCKERWNFTSANAYNLINASSISNGLIGNILPTKASHANKLKKLQNEELRQKAWDEVVLTQGVITGNSIDQVVKKWQLKEDNHFLADEVFGGKVSVEQALTVKDELEKLSLPPYYEESVKKYGTPMPEVLREIRKLEWEFPEEAKDILRSGSLQTEYTSIPFKKIVPSNIRSLKLRLLEERNKFQIEEAKEKQKELLSNEKVLLCDGSDVYDKVKKKGAMYYVFPNDEYDLAQLSKLVEKEKLGVLFVCLYDKENQPDLNFGEGETVKPSSVNGVKPAWLIDMMNKSV